MGKIQGGSLDSAVVIKGDKIISKEPLRYQDEFVRHKILDIVGDLALLGIKLKAHIVAVRPGHALNAKLTQKIYDQMLALKNAPKKTEKKPENWIGRTNELLKKINIAIGDSISAVRKYLENNWQLTLPLAIVLLSLLITLKMAIVQIRQRNLLKRALQYLAEASDPNADNPRRIRCMYYCVRLLLKRANLPRLRNQELLAYAESLEKTDPELSQDTLFLFAQFYMVEYGDYQPDLFETENALNRTNDIKDAVFRIIRAPK